MLLSLMMLFTACAFAEETAAPVDLGKAVENALGKDNAPAGYEYSQEQIEDAIYFSLVPYEDQQKPLYLGSVAYSEEFEDYTLDVSALNDEQKTEMAEKLSEDMFNPTLSFGKTAHGIDLIILNENDITDSDFVEVITIYHGYIITVSVFAAEGEVNQAETDLAIQYLFDKWTADAE